MRDARKYIPLPVATMADVDREFRRLAQSADPIAGNIDGIAGELAALEQRVTQNAADIAALEQRVTQNEADIAQNAVDIATLRGLVFDNLVAAIYGNMLLDGTAAGANIGGGWTALDEFNTIGVTPRGLSLNLDGTFSFNQAGVYRLSLGLVFEHDDLNQGRRTNLRVWDVTNGAAVGAETSIGTGRNVQVTQYSGNSMLEVSQAAVGNVFRFEIGGGDAYSSVVWLTQNLSINGVGEWRGPVPST